MGFLVLLTFGAGGSPVAGLALADARLDALAAVALLGALGHAARPVERAAREALAAHVHRPPLVDHLQQRTRKEGVGGQGGLHFLGAHASSTRSHFPPPFLKILRTTLLFVWGAVSESTKQS